jgi:hypothetical protein
MGTRVECYAGVRYPERPRAFVHQGERLTVAGVEEEERTPRGVRFRVRTADGRRFWLFYDEIDDVWDVEAETSA